MGSPPADETIALYLNGSLRLIAGRVLARDDLSAAFIGLADVLRPAADLAAQAVVIARRHRDGSLQPTDVEAMVAEALSGQAAAAGTPVIDHIVVGAAGGYWSSAEG